MRMVYKHLKSITILVGIVLIISTYYAQGETLDTTKLYTIQNSHINKENCDLSQSLKDIILILFGALIGFVSSYLSHIILENRDKKLRKQKGEQLIKSILTEIEQGIERCDHLIKIKKEGNISFSRIYISLWQSMQVDLSNYIYEFLKDANTLKHIHSIYYTFDLINFNMERNEFGVGAAFANDHRKKIEDEYTMLKTNLIEKKIKI